MIELVAVAVDPMVSIPPDCVPGYLVNSDDFFVLIPLRKPVVGAEPKSNSQVLLLVVFQYL